MQAYDTSGLPMQPAWNLFTGSSRRIFLAELRVDEAMRLRGRGWALSQALIALPYYWQTNPGIVTQALRALDLVPAELADCDQRRIAARQRTCRSPAPFVMITGAPAGYPAATLEGGSSSRVGGRVSADGASGASDAEAREFAAAVRSLLEWVHAPEGGARNEVAALVQRVLGEAGTAESVVTRQLPSFEQVNLQTALNAWSAQAGRQVEVRDVALPPHYGGIMLQQLVSGEGLPPLRLSAPGVVDLPNGPGSTLACLRLALLLVTDAAGRYVLLVQGPSEHQEHLTVEVAGLPVQQAQAVLGELDRLRRRLNVYRGQLLEVGLTPMGGVSLTFLDRPTTSREQVVLPEPVLDRIERHALGVAAHRAALAAAGQHLKRGLLLFGPPGTGKTHTARYLLGQMTDYTRLLLTGRSLGAVGSVTELARELQPAVVVLEDVDLVAADRSFGPGGSPVLFDLLDAMDGAAADADLLFVLTTNRADLLEPALAARPGRVDVAVEIDLPDTDARRRLLELYGRDVPLQLTAADLETAVERSDGVTASFLRELLRRAVLEALHDHDPLTAVTGQHLARALDDLLDSTQSVTRTLLGVGVDPATVPAGEGAPSPGLAPAAGWSAYTSRMIMRRHRP